MKFVVRKNNLGAQIVYQKPDLPKKRRQTYPLRIRVTPKLWVEIHLDSFGKFSILGQRSPAGNNVSPKTFTKNIKIIIIYFLEKEKLSG